MHLRKSGWDSHKMRGGDHYCTGKETKCRRKRAFARWFTGMEKLDLKPYEDKVIDKPAGRDN